MTHTHTHSAAAGVAATAAVAATDSAALGLAVETLRVAAQQQHQRGTAPAFCAHRCYVPHLQTWSWHHCLEGGEGGD